MQYLSFCVWLISLSIMSSRFINIVVSNGRIFFLSLRLNNILLYVYTTFSLTIYWWTFGLYKRIFMVCFKSDRISPPHWFFSQCFLIYFCIFIILTIHTQKGAQGNFWRWWICLLPWLWWWFHERMHMSKPIKYVKYVQFFVYQLYLNKPVFKK